MKATCTGVIQVVMTANAIVFCYISMPLHPGSDAAASKVSTALGHVRTNCRYFSLTKHCQARQGYPARLCTPEAHHWLQGSCPSSDCHVQTARGLLTT